MASTLSFKSAVSTTAGLSAQAVKRVTVSTTVEARVALRFARFGRKHEPFYRLVAVDSRKKLTTAPLEYLGWYNPHTKETNLNAPEIKKWLGNGAQPSDTVRGLLKKALILD